jgi:hypothetical protein
MVIISFPNMPTKTKEHQPNEVLSLRDNAKNQLLEIKSVEEGITYLNKLKAISVWVVAEGKDAELQNIIAEQKLRTQRLLGELLIEAKRKGMRSTGQENLKNVGVEEYDSDKKILSDFGLTKDKSAAFQKIAAIPQDNFEEFINEKKQAVDNAVAELTTAGALRLAKSLEENSENHQQPTAPIPVNTESSPEDQIKEIATYINNTFNKEQKAALITLIFPH